MKSILVGAVDTTRIALEVLAEKGVPPAALFTLPPAKSSRHSDYVDLAPVAHKHGVPMVPMANVNQAEVIDKIRFIGPDYSFVIGWSQICRAEFLSLARLGSIGYHPAPLPENRGRAVIPWTILQDRSSTGSTLFWMDEGADSGDLLCQDIFPVAPDETATTLYQKHGESLRQMMLKTVPDLILEQGQKQPQDRQKASYCAKRTANDGLIDWTFPATDIWRLIRAATRPYPGAFTFYKGRKLVVWAADFVGDRPYWGLPGQIQSFEENGAIVQCGDGQHLRLTRVQIENTPVTDSATPPDKPGKKCAQTGPEIIPDGTLLKLHDKLGLNAQILLRDLCQTF